MAIAALSRIAIRQRNILGAPRDSLRQRQRGEARRQNQEQSQRRPPERQAAATKSKTTSVATKKSRPTAARFGEPEPAATRARDNGEIESGLQFFGFLDEGEEALGADAEIYRGFGVLGALGLLDAALEVRHFGFG
jgi:hypothetical protein